jgi:hypothetical protein
VWGYGVPPLQVVKCRKDLICGAVPARPRTFGCRETAERFLLPPQPHRSAESPVAYMTRLRRALIDANTGQANLVGVRERLCGPQAWHRAPATPAPVGRHILPPAMPG